MSPAAFLAKKVAPATRGPVRKLDVPVALSPPPSPQYFCSFCRTAAVVSGLDPAIVTVALVRKPLAEVIVDEAEEAVE